MLPIKLIEVHKGLFRAEGFAPTVSFFGQKESAMTTQEELWKQLGDAGASELPVRTTYSDPLEIRTYVKDFFGNDNYGIPKKNYISKIALMDDEKLIKETESMIFLSAYANNNPKSDYHWMTDVLYKEWQFRGKVKNYEIAYLNVLPKR